MTAPGVAATGVAIRWQTSKAPRPQADSVVLSKQRADGLPAVDVSLPPETPAKGAESPSLISGLLDGAKDNIMSLVKTVKDKPFLSGAVVLGYHALILTPVAGVVTGGLAALGVISLAKKGMAAVNAHSEGDLYGAGKALGSGLTDLGLSAAPKMLGRVSGGVKAADSAADGLRSFDQLDEIGRMAQSVRSESTIVSVTDKVLRSAKVARRGVTWAESAKGVVGPQPEQQEPA